MLYITSLREWEVLCAQLCDFYRNRGVVMVNVGGYNNSIRIWDCKNKTRENKNRKSMN